MFAHKTVLITGASSGLGRALAIAFCAQGANVVLMGRDLAMLTETAQACKNAPTQPHIVQGDVTQSADCLRAVTASINCFGQLDYLLLNAGISMWSKFEEMTDVTLIQKMMETNYFGAVYCTQHALPYLKKSRGLIAVVSSVQGKIGTPYHSGYAASKHALHGFFDSLRIELKNQVDILLACPSWISGTALKQRALTNQQNISLSAQRKHQRSAIPLDVCVKQIMSAMAQRKREFILPKLYRCLPVLKLFSPGLLDWLVQRKVE